MLALHEGIVLALHSTNCGIRGFHLLGAAEARTAGEGYFDGRSTWLSLSAFEIFDCFIGG